MKGLTLTLATILFTGFFIPNFCSAQTHRLLSQIEETERGNNIWDKVTVMLPNNNYTLNNVTYENNTLLVLFDYTQTMSASRNYFTFNLSDYEINPQQVNQNAAFQVIAKPKDSILGTNNCPPNCLMESGNNPVLMDFRCPTSCTF